jgi:hypothetical protein
MSEAKRAYDMLRGFVNREWERITGVDDLAHQELDEPVYTTTTRVETSATMKDPDGRARGILGVASTANFEEIKAAYDRLNLRSDPGNFPDGSVEARHAAEINQKVQWAYRHLTEKMDSTERRFRSLEID